MRLPRRPFVLSVLSLLAIPAGTRAQADRPIEARWSCFTDPGQSSIYTTRVWDATATLIEVTHGFAQFLLAEYGYKGRVSCGGALRSTSTTAQLTDDNAKTRALWRGEGKTVIETTYTFDPAKASLAFACIGFSRVRDGTAYADSIFLSPVLRIPGNSQQGLSLAWIEYLEESHPESPIYPGAGCTMLPPDPAEHQAQIDHMPSAYNAPTPAILHLDWTYIPRPQPPAADPSPTP
jgi:hypothetical protein